MGSFNLDTLVMDDKISESGVWVDFYQGSKLKIASSDSRRYKSALSREAKKHRIEMDDSNPENYDIIMKVTCKVQAEHILLDWKGIDFQGKEDVQYTPEMGMLALLSSPKLRDFIGEKSNEVDIFKARTVEAVKKP